MPEAVKTTDDKLRESLDDRLRGKTSSLALGIGALMIVVGAVLAAISRPESALVWAGALLVIAGVLGDRLQSLELGTSGGKISLLEKRSKLDEVIYEAVEPELLDEQPEPESGGPGMAEEAAFGTIGGALWTQPAVQTVVTAMGSDSRTDFDLALKDLKQQIAAGRALVTPESSAKRSRRVRNDQAETSRQSRLGTTKTQS